MSWLNIFRTPTPEQIVARQLRESKRAALAHAEAAEYNAAQAKYHEETVKRLSRYGQQQHQEPSLVTRKSRSTSVAPA